MNLLHAMDFWKFFGGLGLFLMAMNSMESSLKILAGRSFKKIIRNNTGTPGRGVISGTLATALLQSSSVVTLMVLAFVGAGVISMQNALGVIFGSNLGTTLTGWLVALFGFKIEIQRFSFPLIGIGILVYTLLPQTKKLAEFSRFIASVGLLFLGLDFMKEAMADVSSTIDISLLHGYNALLYFIFGMIFTAIIQSSSATMMITLTALHAGVLTLPGAAALIVGADLGTTTTTLMGGLGGSSAKRQTAMAHFLFNVVTDIIALILLKPLLLLSTLIFQNKEPLLSLVFFHSTFNVMGILIFFPFTGLFAKFLRKYFSQAQNSQLSYISKVKTTMPEAAIEALHKELRQITYDVQFCNLRAYGLRKTNQSFFSVYEDIKRKIGDALEYLLEIQKQNLSIEDSKKTGQFLKAIDALSRSAKSAKDIHHNMKDFEQSATPKMISYQEDFNQSINAIYNDLYEIEKLENESHVFEEITRLMTLNNDTYNKHQQNIYETMRHDELEDDRIITLTNVNREIHTSIESLLHALKEIYLSSEKAEEI